jgi:hypothetical protein
LELLGFHSKPSPTPLTGEWVQITLREAKPVESISIFSMNHQGVKGFGFPKRFKIETSQDAEFKNPVVVVDQTGSDYPNPQGNAVVFPLDGSKIAAVRITVIEPWESTLGKPAGEVSLGTGRGASFVVRCEYRRATTGDGLIECGGFWVGSGSSYQWKK